MFWRAFVVHQHQSHINSIKYKHIKYKYKYIKYKYKCIKYNYFVCQYFGKLLLCGSIKVTSTPSLPNFVTVWFKNISLKCFNTWLFWHKFLPFQTLSLKKANVLKRKAKKKKHCSFKSDLPITFTLCYKFLTQCLATQSFERQDFTSKCSKSVLWPKYSSCQNVMTRFCGGASDIPKQFCCHLVLTCFCGGASVLTQCFRQQNLTS